VTGGATQDASEDLPGLGLYVHWPWCLSKCPYCDFNSHAIRDPDPEVWGRAYARELDSLAETAPSGPLASVFFGGGTPSLMEPATVGAVLAAADRLFGLAPDCEITLEANPGAVDQARFAGVRAAGVNRLSLGVQALDDAALALLGRRHDRAEALAALDLARATFPRVSLDLIYARPGQTPDAWTRELTEALALGTDHLSLYELTIERGTAFFGRARAGLLTPPDDDMTADLYEITQGLTAAAGVPAYEVSNHARPGAECRHNRDIWRGGDYLGIGPGAHGRLTGEATRCVSLPRAWLERVGRLGHGIAERTALSPRERAEERVMMGLRLTEGIAADRFRRLSGLDLTEVVDGAAAADLTELGLITWTRGRLTATPAGRLCLNAVTARLLG